MVELTPQTVSIQSLYSWFREGKLHVNRRYQRKLVWTVEEKQRLVESILKRYPIPAILLAEREAESGTYEIIDGLQRLHAIVSFIETAFTTLDDKLFALQYFTTAQSASSEGLFEPNTGPNYLSQRDVSTLLDYSLAVSTMRNATLADINDVFGRINSYGHRLSDQERRQAGVQNEFSNLVRLIACTLRGDVSADSLPLAAMPSISIDLPMTKHGYSVQADEVFWVQQGILRSTDLRDSMDEQCIADIAASTVGGALIERTKDALDHIYDVVHQESTRVSMGLETYGGNRFADEFLHCVDEILKVVSASSSPLKLRDLVSNKASTNPIPSVFAVIIIAFHELIFKQSMTITDYPGVNSALVKLTGRITTGRGGISEEERRKNVDVIKGLVGSCFVTAEPPKPIYGGHTTIDLEALIRRSEIELAHYELKQGLLTLADHDRGIDPSMVDKVAKTICAIANNGPTGAGKLLIGVTDKEADADRIKNLDTIQPKKIGKRFVVGVAREAALLGVTAEAYVAQWRDGIRNSALSIPLKDQVLSTIDFNNFYGLGVIVINVPEQKELSFFADEVYWRDADSTVKAATAPQIASISKGF